MTAPEGTPEVENETAEDIPLGEVESDDDIDGLDARSREIVQKARREAHNLRTRLREAEEQIGAAAAREGARDKAEAERIAAEALIDPTDLWNQAADVQAFYDEEFQQLVPDKVREATAAIIASKPHLARAQVTPPPTDRPIEGLRSGARAEEPKTPTTWASALRGR